jgi:hypothetical protein
MKLKQLLNRLQPQSLHLLSQTLRMQGNGDIKISTGTGLVDSITVLLCDAKEQEKVLASFRSWTKGVFAAAVRAFGPLPFDQQALEAAALAEGYSGAHVKASLAILRKKGIVFGLRKSWGEELLLLPEDMLPLWQKLLFPVSLVEAEREALEMGDTFGSTGMAAYDVLHLLYYLRRSPVKNTRQGSLPKAAVRKLEQSLLVQDSDLKDADIRSAFPDAYGPALSSVMDMAIRAGLVRLVDEEWSLHKPTLGEWLDQPLEAIMQELYQKWAECAKGGEAWELHAWTQVEEAVPGKWYILDRLFEWLRDCGMINRINDQDLEHFVQARLIPMQAFGWIRLMRLPGNETAFCLSFPLRGCTAITPTPYSGVIVQSDLEIILMPSPPAALLWELMSWCEGTSRGDIYVFRITKDSIKRGVEQGITAEHMTEVLSSSSCVPVDDRVLSTIKDWAGRLRGTLQTGVTLLQLEDPSLQELVESHEACSKHLHNKIGDSTYIVSPSHAEALLKEMDKLGIAIFRNKEEDTLGHPISTGTIPNPVLIPKLQDPVFAASVLEEDYTSEWRNVPASWWKEAGKYHMSTRKDIVRKAIDWKAPIRLLSHEGASWDIIPRAIKEEEGGWAIQGLRGHESITVHSGEWDGITLILPGVND